MATKEVEVRAMRVDSGRRNGSGRGEDGGWEEEEGEGAKEGGEGFYGEEEKQVGVRCGVGVVVRWALNRVFLRGLL